jgi:hypothetical protein
MANCLLPHRFQSEPIASSADCVGNPHYRFARAVEKKAHGPGGGDPTD